MSLHLLLLAKDLHGWAYFLSISLSKVILSEKAVESGGAMDMDDIKTEEEMNKKIESYDKILLEEASDNVPLQVVLYAAPFDKCE